MRRKKLIKLATYEALMGEDERLALVERLEREGVLRDARVKRALLVTDMSSFLPPRFRAMAYSDRPVPFYESGGSVRTISAPSIIAEILQRLELREGNSVLVLGSKSGYLEALVCETAHVSRLRVVEHSREIRRITEKNLTGRYPEIRVSGGDPTKGFAREAPWDRILVTGRVDRIPPALRRQLAPGGILIAPVGGPEVQTLLAVRREGRGYKEEALMDVVFSPLEAPPPKLSARERRLATYGKVLEHFLADGPLTQEERALLGELRSHLRIDAKSQSLVEERVRRARGHRVMMGPAAIENYISRLQKGLRRGDVMSARAVFNEIMCLPEDTADGWICKSVAHYMLGGLDKAVRCLDRAVELDRHHVLIPPAASLLIRSLISLCRETGEKLRDPSLSPTERARLLRLRQAQEEKLSSYAELVLESDPEDQDALSAKLYLRRRSGELDGYA